MVPVISGHGKLSSSLRLLGMARRDQNILKTVQRPKNANLWAVEDFIVLVVKVHIIEALVQPFCECESDREDIHKVIKSPQGFHKNC